jgi:uncharacterized MnhB-related membrane protein
MERIEYLLLFLGAVFLAYRAIVSQRILSSTIYLAGISALISVVLYKMGATQVAVMELSVGAGLVTVLLVYAVSVVGDDALDPASVIPKPLAIIIVGLAVFMVGWMVYPSIQTAETTGPVDLASVLWGTRVLDVWIQIVLIFSGVMGVLGLLSERIRDPKKEAHS